MKPSLLLVQDGLTKHLHQTLPSLLTAPQVGRLGGLPVFTGRWPGGLLGSSAPSAIVLRTVSNGSSLPHLLMLCFLTKLGSRSSKKEHNSPLAASVSSP